MKLDERIAIFYYSIKQLKCLYNIDYNLCCDLYFSDVRWTGHMGT